ncbi:MAG: glycosyltransferase [Gammaproteobacteria bacterium]|nr:glycosyltransferase [Gammaproteobacteria bacterium]
MKNKIAIIGSRGYPYVYSGYETFVRETFELLTDRYEVHVYCHAPLFDEKPDIVNGINLHYVPAINTKSLNQLSNSFLATLHALIFCRYDVILYVNTANGPFGLLTRLMRVKTAIITDGLEWLRPKWQGMGAKYFYFASKLSTRVFDVLISDSTEMQKIYQSEFDAESVVIEYGAHLKYSTKPEMLEQFGLEPDDYYLVVARLVPDNNADIIVEGFAQANISKKLVVVGDVPYQDDYSIRVKSLAAENILFTGYVYDQEVLQELYTNSYVYIHGHEHGGTNPTLLKALAYGCSILALDTRFSREVLKNEQHGTYFDKSAESLSAGVKKLELEPTTVAAQKEKSRERISERYTWSRIADEYHKLFKKMVNS